MVIKDLLTFYKYHEGVQRVGLDLSQLYEDEKERRKFDDRYKGFKAANPLKKGVFALKGDIITYLTEEIIPKKTNDKKPLLLLFGNPAPQSVKTKMFFAREISGKEHRIWSVLENTGFLKFNFDESKIKTINEVNEARKKALYELSYDSPFRIGFAVFYSMPSPASDKKWGGVAGLRLLFGAKAFNKIGEFEKKRVNKIIDHFLKPNGSVIAFQKDAYLGVSSSTVEYSANKAMEGKLKGTCDRHPNIKILCSPSTRLIQSKQAVKVLKNFERQWEMSH